MHALTMSLCDPKMFIEARMYSKHEMANLLKMDKQKQRISKGVMIFTSSSDTLLLHYSSSVSAWSCFFYFLTGACFLGFLKPWLFASLLS